MGDSQKEQSPFGSGAILINRLPKRGYFLVGMAEPFRVRRGILGFPGRKKFKGSSVDRTAAQPPRLGRHIQLYFRWTFHCADYPCFKFINGGSLREVGFS